VEATEQANGGRDVTTIELAEKLSKKWWKQFCWVASSNLGNGWYVRGDRKPAHSVTSYNPGTHFWRHISKLQMMRFILHEVRWTERPSLLRDQLETAQDLRDTEWLLRCMLNRTAKEMDEMADDTP
jgi:hypothetical protein